MYAFCVSLRCKYLITSREFERSVRSLVSVFVKGNNVDKALRQLKKKMQREGIFREMKNRRHFEKPSERAKREKDESVRRFRKAQRQRGDN